MVKSRYFIIEVQKAGQFFESSLNNDLIFSTDFEIEQRYFFAFEFKKIQAKEDIESILANHIKKYTSKIIQVIPCTKKIIRYPPCNFLYVTNLPKNFDKVKTKDFIKKFCIGECTPKKCFCYYSIKSDIHNLDRLVKFLPMIPVQFPIMASYSCIDFPILRFSKLSLNITEESLASYIFKFAKCQAADIKCSKPTKGQKYANVLLQSFDDFEKVIEKFNFCTIDNIEIYVKPFLEPDMGIEIKKYEIAVADLPENIQHIDFYNEMSQFGRIFDFVIDLMHLVGYVTFIYTDSREKLLNCPKYHTYYSIVTILMSNFPPKTTCDDVKKYFLTTVNSKSKKPQNKLTTKVENKRKTSNTNNSDDKGKNNNNIEEKIKSDKIMNKEGENINNYNYDDDIQVEEEETDDNDNKYQEENAYSNKTNENEQDDDDEYDNNENEHNYDDNAQEIQIDNYIEEEEDINEDENYNINNDNDDYNNESGEEESKEEEEEFDPKSIESVTIYEEEPPSDPTQIKVSYTLPAFLIKFKDPFSIDFAMKKLKHGLYNNTTVPYAIRYFPRPIDNNEARSAILTNLGYENDILITPIHTNVTVEQMFNICVEYGVILFFQINRKKDPNFCIVKYQNEEQYRSAFEKISGSNLNGRILNVYDYPIKKENFEDVISNTNRNSQNDKNNDHKSENLVIIQKNKHQNHTKTENSHSSSKVNIIVPKRKTEEKNFNVNNIPPGPPPPPPPLPPPPSPPPQYPHWMGRPMQMPMGYDPHFTQYNNFYHYHRHPKFHQCYPYPNGPYFPNGQPMTPEQQRACWNWQWNYINPNEDYSQEENRTSDERGGGRRGNWHHDNPNNNNNNKTEPENKENDPRRGGKCGRCGRGGRRRHERCGRGGNEKESDEREEDSNKTDQRNLSNTRGTWWGCCRGGRRRGRFDNYEENNEIEGEQFNRRERNGCHRGCGCRGFRRGGRGGRCGRGGRDLRIENPNNEYDYDDDDNENEIDDRRRRQRHHNYQNKKDKK